MSPPGCTTATIAAARLGAQRLIRKPFETAVEAVRSMAAVQSQDYAGAKWALGQRVVGATDAAIDRLYDQGAILRTHVLRPTWHFVLPEDIRWLLDLTGPKVLTSVGGRHRQLGIDRGVITRARLAFENGLSGGRSLTREELGEVLLSARIPSDGQRLPHLIMAAELEGQVVSGPRRGRLMTYALLDERAPNARVLEPMEALRELTRRYFCSHGPAQLQDLAWWSGLTQADARRGVELAGAGLAKRSIDGTDYWFDPELEWRPAGRVAVHLLPNFDEYTVGYRDRSAMLHADYPFRPELFAFSSILSNVVTAGGQLRAAWRRTASGPGLRVEVQPLAPLDPVERAGVEQACRRFSRFLERPVELVWGPATRR